MGKIRLIFGICINDADYSTSKEEKVNGKRKNTWVCPYYTCWYSMLRRCYSENYQKRQRTYIGCTVCKEWLLFSNFKKWMMLQKWEYRCLDKDFLVNMNKVYSPTTCVFLPKELNNFITTNGARRGKYPIGVTFRKSAKVNNYMCAISRKTNPSGYVSVHNDPHSTHMRYLSEKLKVCEVYLEEFKLEPLIVMGLERVRDKILYHINNDLELTEF